MRITKEIHTSVNLTRDEVAKILIKYIKETENIDITRVSFITDDENLIGVECHNNEKETIK